MAMLTFHLKVRGHQN